MQDIILTVLMLALVSPALADTARCRTRSDEAFKRWITECSDGSRAITTYDPQFKRYQTDVISPPKGDKPMRGWPVPGKKPR
ncbi:MAG: hypothetical protein ACRERE_04680 [Candidatus Entotheonellia bacterium]